MLDRSRQPYRAIRFERKLESVAHDPVVLLECVRGMARRTSDGLESLVEYNRLDLSVETLIIGESKIYAAGVGLTGYLPELLQTTCRQPPTRSVS